MGRSGGKWHHKLSLKWLHTEPARGRITALPIGGTGKRQMIEGTLSVPTRDGAMQTFYCYPERPGPHPVVVFLMDAPGIREELREMVRRLATAGYYVALPNLYYRSGVMELGPIPRRAEGPMIPIILSHMNSLTVAMVMDDIEALTASLDAEAPVRGGPSAAIG